MQKNMMQLKISKKEKLKIPFITRSARINRVEKATQRNMTAMFVLGSV
jgi:hypothetical protein